MRFVSKQNDDNIGFTEVEIAVLSERIFIHPENVFMQFLKNAGKKSNAFDTNFKDLNEYLSFQDSFNEMLKNDPEFSAYAFTSYCFQSRFTTVGEELYYFVKTEKPRDEDVFYYSPDSSLIGDYLRDGRDDKSHLKDLQRPFTEYLDWVTRQKFGATSLAEKIRGTLSSLFKFLIGKRN
jgi:hypothetical protein